jgi:riboflavin biosynthesis pyrimidine reductase
LTVLEQLFPQQRELPVEQAYGELRLSERARDDRPYVVANMVASVDGRATLSGRSGSLANEADKQIFLDLRTQVDAVMAGPATIGIENYGPLIKSDERKQRRRARGLEPVPLAVTVSGSMELPVLSPLFQDPGSRIVVITNSERPPPPCAAELIVERIPGDTVDIVAGLGRLRSAHGVRSLLHEGGPTLLGSVTACGALDELFLTRSPSLVGGGDEITILEGAAPEQPLSLELVSLMREGGYLFLRYAVARSA